MFMFMRTDHFVSIEVFRQVQHIVLDWVLKQTLCLILQNSPARYEQNCVFPDALQYIDQAGWVGHKHEV